MAVFMKKLVLFQMAFLYKWHIAMEDCEGWRAEALRLQTVVATLRTVFERQKIRSLMGVLTYILHR